MFIDEAKIAVELTHANICQVTDLGRINNNYFIAMEFINGKDLRGILKKAFQMERSIPIPYFLFMAHEVLKGLDYAHTRRDSQGQALNLIHRDISPQNIMVSYHGEVKIVDFGIAKTGSKAHRTQVGVLKGKFGYMSPEQASGLDLDARTDLFSTAILLYECLTQRRLFHADTDYKILEMIKECSIPRPSNYQADISPHLEDFLLKALARKPEDRFQSAYEMLSSLGKILYSEFPEFSPRHLANFMEDLFKSEIVQEQEALRRAMDAVPQEKLDLLASAAEPSFRPQPTTQVSTSRHNPLLNERAQEATNSLIVKVDDSPKKSGSLLGTFFKLLFFLILPAYLSYSIFYRFIAPTSESKKSPSKNSPNEKLPPLPIAFNSAPPGATVYINDHAQGVTPVQISLRPDKTYDVRFELEGYEPLTLSEYISPQSKDVTQARLKKKVILHDILVETQPSGATVSVNGKLHQERTPLTLKQLEPEKPYSLTLKKSGYLEVTIEKNLREDPSNISVALQKASTTLSLTIQPKNALITLNDSVVSDTIDSLTPGQVYTLKFSSPGYESKTVKHTAKGRRDELSVNLKKIPVKMGQINVNVKPWANVIIDGKPIGNTPLLDHDLPVGKHQFIFEHPDYPRVTRNIEIKQGPNPSIVIDFTKNPS